MLTSVLITALCLPPLASGHTDTFLPLVLHSPAKHADRGESFDKTSNNSAKKLTKYGDKLELPPQQSQAALITGLWSVLYILTDREVQPEYVAQLNRCLW